jgi:hypothetical protein
MTITKSPFSVVGFEVFTAVSTEIIWYLYEFTNVSAVLTASIIRAMRINNNRPDNGGSKHRRNVGKLISIHAALQPRRQPSSFRVVDLRTDVKGTCETVVRPYCCSY